MFQGKLSNWKLYTSQYIWNIITGTHYHHFWMPLHHLIIDTKLHLSVNIFAKLAGRSHWRQEHFQLIWSTRHLLWWCIFNISKCVKVWQNKTSKTFPDKVFTSILQIIAKYVVEQLFSNPRSQTLWSTVHWQPYLQWTFQKGLLTELQVPSFYFGESIGLNTGTWKFNCRPAFLLLYIHTRKLQYSKTNTERISRTYMSWFYQTSPLHFVSIWSVSFRVLLHGIMRKLQ